MAFDKQDLMDLTEVAPLPVAPQLPDNHPIEWFGDAKRLFKDCLPPFAHKGTFGLRKRVVLAQWQDKNRSPSEVAHRRWDRWHLVTTIDLNGQRYIVRGFGCAGGGLRYHCWDGHIQDFGTYAVAYSWPREVAGRLEYLRETYEPGSGLQGVEHVWNSPAQNPRPIQPIVQNNIIQKRIENDGQLQRTVSSPREFTSASDDISANNKKYGQAGLRQSHGFDLSPKSSTLSKQQSTETQTHMDGGQRTASTTFRDPWNSVSSLKRPATTSLPQAGPSYVFMPVNEPMTTLIGDQTTNPQRSEKQLHDETRAESPSFDANYKRRRHDYEHSGDHDNFGEAIDLTTSPNYPSPRPSLGSGPSQGDLEKLASTPARQTPLEDTLDAPLSPYKQRHTTLRIVLPLSSDFVPLRLSSFMTTASLFESSIEISGSKSQDLKISGLRVTFDWKGEHDVDRAMLLKQEYPDSFEIFLETVANAPCWKSDGGRCSVGVEVVLE